MNLIAINYQRARLYFGVGAQQLQLPEWVRFRGRLARRAKDGILGGDEHLGPTRSGYEAIFPGVCGDSCLWVGEGWMAKRSSFFASRKPNRDALALAWMPKFPHFDESLDLVHEYRRPRSN